MQVTFKSDDSIEKEKNNQNGIGSGASAVEKIKFRPQSKRILNHSYPSKRSDKSCNGNEI